MNCIVSHSLTEEMLLAWSVGELAVVGSNTGPSCPGIRQEIPIKGDCLIRWLGFSWRKRRLLVSLEVHGIRVECLSGCYSEGR